MVNLNFYSNTSLFLDQNSVNIGSHKTAVEEEWNRIFKEFILKAYKSFRRCVDTIIEKKCWLYFVNLCVYLFCSLFCKIRINLVYDRVVYYFTRIFFSFALCVCIYIYIYAEFPRTPPHSLSPPIGGVF